MAVYLIAAGGTGGHIHPGIAVAEEIRRHEADATVYFCGTTRGMESRLVPEHGYTFLPIDARGFAGKSPVDRIRAVVAFVRGRRQCRKILRERHVDFVIGTGGYVCGPALSAARSLRIPALIHEQNAYPGKANRWLSDKVDCVCISYPATASYFHKAARVELTGNPVREIFFQMTRDAARKALGILADEKLLFVTGGSLGARSINNAVVELAERCPSPGYRIILSCGSSDYPSLKDRLSADKGVLDIHEYLRDQHLYMAAADLVLCRAGAITCSEIAVLGKASVMVPYPHAAGDHQTMNARAFEEAGASVLIPDRKLEFDMLHQLIEGLLSDPEQLLRMEHAARGLAYPDAAGSIYRQIQIVRTDRVRGR
jgi:UDP-N-acetylglucosamine--N-acetylmuramyl-(pentapeptide) pyrophosphoryl-undecaprenol N-acetylglucosamine transferase